MTGTRSSLMALLCFVLVAMLFLPWVQLFGQSLSGFDIGRLGSYGNWAWVPALIAGAALLLALVGVHSRVLAVLAGLAPWAGLIYLVALGRDLPFQLSEALWHVMGVGAWANLAVGAALVLTAVLPEVERGQPGGVEPASVGDGGSQALPASMAAALIEPAPAPASAPREATARNDFLLWPLIFGSAAVLVVLALGAFLLYLQWQRQMQDAGARTAQIEMRQREAEESRVREDAEREQRHAEDLARLAAQQGQLAEQLAAERRAQEVQVTVVNDNCADEAFMLDGEWQFDVLAGGRRQVTVKAGPHQAWNCVPALHQPCSERVDVYWQPGEASYTVTRNPLCR